MLSNHFSSLCRQAASAPWGLGKQRDLRPTGVGKPSTTFWPCDLRLVLLQVTSLCVGHCLLQPAVAHRVCVGGHPLPLTPMPGAGTAVTPASTHLDPIHPSTHLLQFHADLTVPDVAGMGREKEGGKEGRSTGSERLGNLPSVAQPQPWLLATKPEVCHSACDLPNSLFLSHFCQDPN